MEYYSEQIGVGRNNFVAPPLEDGISLLSAGGVRLPRAVQTAHRAWKQLTPQALLEKINARMADASPGTPTELHWRGLRAYAKVQLSLYSEAAEDFQKYHAAVERMSLEEFYNFRQNAGTLFKYLTTGVKTFIHECKIAHLNGVLSAIIMNVGTQGKWAAAEKLCEEFIKPAGASSYAHSSLRRVHLMTIAAERRRTN